jgi:hypothetical protein
MVDAPFSIFDPRPVYSFGDQLRLPCVACVTMHQQSKHNTQPGPISPEHLHPGLSTDPKSTACTVVAVTNKAATRRILKIMMKGWDVCSLNSSFYLD